MKLQVLIPTGCWKVDIDSTNDHNTIRLSGSVLSDGQWRTEKKIQIIYLTHEQARELVEGLRRALREFELQRSASLARVARGEA